MATAQLHGFFSSFLLGEFLAGFLSGFASSVWVWSQLISL
jgi:hypothetical protein